jgi:hypothetical protein
MHPQYSPWAETITVDALSSVGVDPTAFLNQAVQALDEEDALYYQRLAQVLAAYGSMKSPLQSIQVQGGTVCAMDGNGNLVVPLSCDYAVWSDHASARVDEFTALRQSRPETKGLALWVDGKVSNRGLEELKSRNIEVVTGVLDKAAN